MSTADIKTAQTVTDKPEKLDLRSFDIPDDKRAELLALFPEARSEGGKVDFDRLKLALGETVDVGKERYGMNWPGKGDCFRTIQAPSIGTLRPDREESVTFSPKSSFSCNEAFLLPSRSIQRFEGCFLRPSK